MRLLIGLGYDKILFARGANVSELINAFDKAVYVRETGYGKERCYQPQDSENISLELVTEDSVSLPESTKLKEGLTNLTPTQEGSTT